MTYKKFIEPAYNQNTGEYLITYLNEDGGQVLESFDETKHTQAFGKLQIERLKKIFTSTADLSTLPSDVGVDLTKQELYLNALDIFSECVRFDNQYYSDYCVQYSFNTFVHDLYEHVPITMVVAPSNRGKTVLLETFSKTCYRPFFGSGADSAAFSTRATDLGCTLIKDEAQIKLSDPTDKFHGILTSGTSKSGRINIVRATKDGKDFATQSFKVFGPKVIGARYIPDDEAISSRSCVLKLGKIDSKKIKDLFDPLSPELTRLSQQHRNNMTLYRLKRLSGLDDRISVEELENFGYQLEGRTKKLFLPLLQEAANHTIRDSLYSLIQDMSIQQREAREYSLESSVLISAYKIHSGVGRAATCKNIALDTQDWIGTRIAPKTVGKILKQYSIPTRRTECGFALDCSIDELKQKLVELDINVPEKYEKSNF